MNTRDFNSRFTKSVLVAVALLASCDTDSPQARLENYANRMARVLETQIEHRPTTPESLVFPRPRTLRFEHQGLSIDLIDYLSLTGCELQRTVARSNDSLGKVAKPSTKLVLHLNFLRLAPKCIERLNARGETKLAGTLARAMTSKREQLPSVIWRATLGSDEYRSFWRRPNNLARYPTQMYAEVDAALVSLTAKADRWMNGDYVVDADSLEAELKRLSAGDGGALLKSLSVQYEILAAIDAAIEQRLDAKPLCYHSASARGNILDNVVRKFFIADVQAWSARVEARRFKLLPKVEALENALSTAEPKAFTIWKKRRDESIARAAIAPKQHAKTLLPLLHQCGKAPGSAV